MPIINFIKNIFKIQKIMILFIFFSFYVRKEKNKNNILTMFIYFISSKFLHYSA